MNGRGGPWALRSRRIVTPEGIVDGAVVIEGERIVEVTPLRDELPEAVEDVGAAAILPGDSPGDVFRSAAQPKGAPGPGPRLPARQAATVERTPHPGRVPRR